VVATIPTLVILDCAAFALEIWLTKVNYQE
jgi:hypothetical protein